MHFGQRAVRCETFDGRDLLAGDRVEWEVTDGPEEWVGTRIAFDLKRVMQTDYRIDDFQQTYFVIPSFEELLRASLRNVPLAEDTGDAERWIAQRLERHRNPPSLNETHRADGSWLQIAERRTEDGGTNWSNIQSVAITSTTVPRR